MRESDSQPEFGLLGAGPVSAGLMGRLPRRDQMLGPVAGVSFRVASRIVNSLRAGAPARSPAELDAARVILICSSPEQFPLVLEILGSAEIRWQGKSVVFFDCEQPESAGELLRSRGASVACLTRSPLPGRLRVEGDGAALAIANRLSRDLGMKFIEVDRENVAAFDLALTLGTGALSPLIDQTAALLRQCGIRDGEAARLAAALFEQTARDYARTGRQSWVWHQRAPDAARLLGQLAGAGSRLRRLAGDLILFGLDEAGRHRLKDRE